MLQRKRKRAQSKNRPPPKEPTDAPTVQRKRTRAQSKNKEPPRVAEEPTGAPTSQIDENSNAFHIGAPLPGMEIKKVETSKDKIKQPELARDEKMVLPPLGSSIVICGSSGSGKSTLLQNLMTDPRFYGPCKEAPEGWFDETFLFSPTGSSDDVLRSLKIKKSHVFTDLDDADELLEVIQSSQKRRLEGGNRAHRAPQYCVILEDFIGEQEFMKTKQFKRLFYMVRHLNCTTIACVQHYHRLPKVCRLQAAYTMFFAGSLAEVEIITEEFAPPLYSKREFMELVHEATRERFSFLTICRKVEWRWRFRRNLSEFISLHRLESIDEGEEPEETKERESTPKRNPLPPNMHKLDKAGFYETKDKIHSNLQQLIKFILASDHADQQTERVLGEWAHKGARGRTIF